MCVGLGEPVDGLEAIQGLVSIAQSHVDSHAETLKHSGSHSTNTSLGNQYTAMHPTTPRVDTPIPCTWVDTPTPCTSGRLETKTQHTTNTDMTNTQSTSCSADTQQGAVLSTPNINPQTKTSPMHDQSVRSRLSPHPHYSHTFTNLTAHASLCPPESSDNTAPCTSTQTLGPRIQKGNQSSRHGTKLSLGKHFSFSLGNMQKKYRLLRKYLPGSLRRTYSGTLLMTKGLGHHLTCVMRKQTLRSLSFSYQNKVGHAHPSFGMTPTF